MGTIQYSANQVPIQTLCLLYEKGCLNLEPGFQRSSVWRLSDRSKLIDSIVRNYPLPAIFLHERKQNGNVIYDVIDGKQRIESVLMFVGEMKGNRFSARCHLDSESSPIIEDLPWGFTSFPWGVISTSISSCFWDGAAVDRVTAPGLITAFAPGRIR